MSMNLIKGDIGTIWKLAGFAFLFAAVGCVFIRKKGLNFCSIKENGFQNRSPSKLKELSQSFENYRLISAKQQDEIKIIQQSLKTMRQDMEVRKIELEQSTKANTNQESPKLLCKVPFFNKAPCETDQARLHELLSLLSGYPILSAEVNEVAEIEKLQSERINYHEKVMHVFDDYQKDFYQHSSVYSLVSTDASLVLPGMNKL